MPTQFISYDVLSKQVRCKPTGWAAIKLSCQEKMVSKLGYETRATRDAKTACLTILLEQGYV